MDLELLRLQHPNSLSRWGRLSKVELHCHLVDTIRLSTLIEEFIRAGRELPDDPKRYFRMTRPFPNLAEYLQFLDRCASVLSCERAIKRVAKEVVIDKCEDGVKLLELRYGPTEILRPTGANLSFDQVHLAVKSGIDEGLRECQAKGKEMQVGLICSAIGAFGVEDARSVVDFLLQNRADFIGFDIAASDDIRLADFQAEVDRVHAAGIPISLHAGEEYTRQSWDNLQDAVEKLHAVRIGHGTQALEQEFLANLVSSSNIHLEICPVSEYFTGSVREFSNHPVRNVLNKNLNISLSTDNPGPLNLDFNTLYELLHQTFGMDEQIFRRLNKNALEASFMPQNIKDHVRDKFFKG